MKKIFYKSIFLFSVWCGFFSLVLLPHITFAQNNINLIPTLTSSPTGCGNQDSSECYQFLEPLPAVDSNGNPAEATAINIPAGDDSGSGIALSVNNFYQIALALGSVLAVVMIVIYGYRYMVGEKSVNDLTALKSKITNVVLGILLLLGIYVILNTINPQLVDVAPGITKVEIEDEGFIEDENFGPDNYTPDQLRNQLSPACSEGFTKVSVFTVCKSVAQYVQRMVNDARAAGYILDGGGFRTNASQVELRKKHCGTSHSDIYLKKSTSCNPPTAVPGTSNHENGYALDLKCNGAKFAGSGCYNWMVQNAAKYGFKNLRGEPWHWSTGPKAGR